MFSLLRRWLPALFIFLVFGALTVSAQTNLSTGFGPVQITLGANNGPQDVDTGIKVLATLTLLTLAPSIMLLMTCFTRIVIVLSFVRTALQLQGTPANQIIVGLSLFLTLFIMQPVWDGIQNAHAVSGEPDHQPAGDGPRDGAHPHLHAATGAAQGRGIVRANGEITANETG